MVCEWLPISVPKIVPMNLSESLSLQKYISTKHSCRFCCFRPWRGQQRHPVLYPWWVNDPPALKCSYQHFPIETSFQSNGKFVPDQLSGKRRRDASEVGNPLLLFDVSGTKHRSDDSLPSIFSKRETS